MITGMPLIDPPVGSDEWYKGRTDLFNDLPDDVWDKAGDASSYWQASDAELKQKVWDRMIDRCHENHPEYTRYQIQQAFECERDEILGKLGEEPE